MMSTVCKSGDLEENDAEEDEEDPYLEQDEAWLYDEGKEQGNMASIFKLDGFCTQVKAFRA